MKKFTLITLAAALAATAIGCTSTAGTNANMKANMTTANANMAVVVNSSNSNMMMNGNMSGSMNSNRYNSNMSRADYEKSTEYSADQAASSIGQGADDKWIWFKTRAALATINNVRDSTINVDVNNSVITLKGTVASKEEADKAVAAAKGIDGQKGVKNELKVNASDSLTNQTVTTGGSDGEGKKPNMNK